ncbi:MAG TPA: hypothetical protein VGO04_24510 [Ensifer sp.]|jgi:hypothetical protein|uniref:hypothetical protein n=1 Tax=Ensifer sp. TaxID=1872086 RepID=UPI002E1651E2|nr:hypothetical protein [Ensifer sp.]
MQVAPIRSPLDMQRAETRLTALDIKPRGSEEELEYAALWDAMEHYRCITERPSPATKQASEILQPRRDRSS